MRSAKETGCFPYGSGQVCYMEVSPDGAVTQLSTVGEKRSAYGNDNPGAKSQGIKQLMAGGGVVLIGTTLIPLLSGLFG